MIDLELSPTTVLRKEGKSFYWASFFLPKTSKKMQAFYIQSVDILMILLIKILKIKLLISKNQLTKLEIIKITK